MRLAFEYRGETLVHVFRYQPVLPLPNFGEVALAKARLLVESFIAGTELLAGIGQHPGLGGLGEPVVQSIVFAGAPTRPMPCKMADIKRLVALRGRCHRRQGIAVIYIERTCLLRALRETKSQGAYNKKNDC